jgi:hypothetical protein
MKHLPKLVKWPAFVALGGVVTYKLRMRRIDVRTTANRGRFKTATSTTTEVVIIERKKGGESHEFDIVHSQEHRILGADSATAKEIGRICSTALAARGMIDASEELTIMCPKIPTTMAVAKDVAMMLNLDSRAIEDRLWLHGAPLYSTLEISNYLEEEFERGLRWIILVVDYARASDLRYRDQNILNITRDTAAA